MCYGLMSTGYAWENASNSISFIFQTDVVAWQALSCICSDSVQQAVCQLCSTTIKVVCKVCSFTQLYWKYFLRYGVVLVFHLMKRKKNTKQNPEIWIKEAKFKTLPQIGCTQHLTRGTEKAWHILYCCRYGWGMKTKPLITLYIYFWNIVRTWSFVAFWKDYNSFIFVCLFAGERVLWDRDCCEPIIMWPKTTLTSGSLCLYFPDIQIAGMHPALCQFFLKLVDELVSHSTITLFRCLFSTTMYQEGS